jgi:hypothetical protein
MSMDAPSLTQVAAATRGKGGKPQSPGSPRQPLNQRLPFLFKRSPVKFSPGPFIPVVGIPSLALFAMQVCMHRHPLRRFELVHQGVRPCPVPFCIPPQGSQGRHLRPRWLFKAQRLPQFFGSHTTFVPPTFLGFPNYSFATNVA